MLWVSYCTRGEGYRHRLIERARRQRVRFYVSAYILDELRKVLTEDLRRSRRFAFLAQRAVLRIAQLVALPPAVRSRVPGDPSDDPIVETAISSKADYLITADDQLLCMEKIQGVAIIRPEQFEHLLPTE